MDGTSFFVRYLSLCYMYRLDKMFLCWYSLKRIVSRVMLTTSRINNLCTNMGVIYCGK